MGPIGQSPPPGTRVLTAAQRNNLPLLKLNGQSDLDRKVTWPLWFAGGVAFKPVPKLTLTGDIQYTGWSTLDTIDAAYQDTYWAAFMGAAGRDKMKMEWSGKSQIRFGAEYALSPALALRAGYYWDPSPAPVKTMNALLPSYDFNVLTFGVGYATGNLHLDFGVEYLLGSERSVDYLKTLTDSEWSEAMPGVFGMKLLVPNLSITPELAIKLSQILAWQIDFYHLQKGDSFNVIYDELYVDDKFFAIGTIKAAHFTHRGKDFYAIPFTQGSVSQYFDENGNSLRKAFLKAPLEFSRISSRYSKSRLHPVIKTRRPHLGVDYAAQVGTPIRTTGDGIVQEAGYNKGAGKFIKIRHNSVYSTMYLHLSRYVTGIKKSTKVQQGQFIDNIRDGRKKKRMKTIQRQCSLRHECYGTVRPKRGMQRSEQQRSS